MGYYTYYSLVVKGPFKKNDKEELVKALIDKDIIGYAFQMPEEINNYLSFSDYDSCKWHSSCDDMEIIASQFPHLTFELTAQGEDIDGCWKYYLHGDETELCEATIPPPTHIKW